MSNDAIADAIAQAQATASQVPAMSSAPAANMPAAVPAGRPRSLTDALASAGAAVDNWLSVDEYGLHVDKDKAIFETVDVSIKLSEVKFGYGVRYQSGSGVQYGKSYDGVREVKSGRPWADFVANAQQMDPKCRGSYDLAEIPMTLKQDLVKKDKSVIEAGKKLGHTTSIMNFKIFMAWVSSALPVYGQDTEIPVRLGLALKKGPTGDYGMVDFVTITN